MERGIVVLCGATNQIGKAVLRLPPRNRFVEPKAVRSQIMKTEPRTGGDNDAERRPQNRPAPVSAQLCNTPQRKPQIYT